MQHVLKDPLWSGFLDQSRRGASKIFLRVVSLRVNFMTMLPSPVSLQPSSASMISSTSHGRPVRPLGGRQIVAAVRICVCHAWLARVHALHITSLQSCESRLPATDLPMGGPPTPPPSGAHPSARDAGRPCFRTRPRQVRTEEVESLPLSGPEPKTFAVAPGQLLNVRILPCFSLLMLINEPPDEIYMMRTPATRVRLA